MIKFFFKQYRYFDYGIVPMRAILIKHLSLCPRVLYIVRPIQNYRLAKIVKHALLAIA